MKTLFASRIAGCIALGLASVLTPDASAAPAKDTYTESIDQSFPLTAGGAFTLENRNGSVEYSTWDKDEVRVVAEKRMELDSGGWWLARLIGLKQSNIETDDDAKALLATFTVEFSGDEKSRSVMTHYPESHDVNCSVVYRITAPRKSKVDIDSTNGSIRVNGVEGEAAVSTTSGSVSVSDVSGRVHAVSTNGRVTLERVNGPVIAKTTNGSVSVSVLPDAPIQDIEMHSVNGSVRLYVPGNATFTVNARTVNGSVRCDLPLASINEQTRKHLDGVVGGGGARVDLSTTNGSVQIGAAG